MFFELYGASMGQCACDLAIKITDQIAAETITERDYKGYKATADNRRTTLGVSIGKERAELDLDAAIDLCESQAGFLAGPSKVAHPTRKMDGLGDYIDIDLMEVSLSVIIIEKLTARTAPLHESRTAPLPLLETLVATQGYVATFHPMLKADTPYSHAILAMAKRQRARSITVSERSVASASHVAESARSQRRIPLMPSIEFPEPGYALRIDVESSAPGSIGFSAISFLAPSSGHPIFYFYGRWSLDELGLHINEKELLVSLWSASVFDGLHPVFYVLEWLDNQVAKCVVRNNKSTRAGLDEIQRRRVTEHLRLGWTSHQRYINTHDDDPSDALGRDRLDLFWTGVNRRKIPRDRIILLELLPSARDTV